MSDCPSVRLILAIALSFYNKLHKMVELVNGSRYYYYRALESVSTASALSSALTIYPCQIRVHQRWQSKLQLPTARKKEWRPATADILPHAVTCQHCDTHYASRHRTHRLLVWRATSWAHWYKVLINDLGETWGFCYLSQCTNVAGRQTDRGTLKSIAGLHEPYYMIYQ